MKSSEKIKKYIKTNLSRFLVWTGLIDIYRYFRMKNKAVILMYHRIKEKDQKILDYSPDGMIVNLENFQEHIIYLLSHYKVISLTELTKNLKAGIGIKSNTCVITFDDGWNDFYKYAYPVLKEYSVPATVFIPINYINGKKWYWEERLKYLLSEIYQHFFNKMGDDKKREVNKLLKKYDIEILFNLKESEFGIFLIQFIRKLKQTSESKKFELIRDLESIHPISEKNIFINWKQITKMAKNGIEFGAHTLSHANLISIPEHDIEEELLIPIQVLKSKLNYTSVTLAYPYGRFDRGIRDKVESSGYSAACTTEFGFVDNNSDKFLLKRININNDTTFSIPMFACRILRFMNIY